MDGSLTSTMDYNAWEISYTADCVHTPPEGKATKYGILEETVNDFTVCK